MAKVKCYSVRLSALTSISEKAYKALAFDGSEAIIPKSSCFGPDYEVEKSNAYWIAAFALEGKGLQYSDKKVLWFERDFQTTNPAKTSHEPQLELIDETPVKGYFLRWQEARVAINAYGKLATKNRQHIHIYEGPAHQAPKGFISLSDEEFEMAKTKVGSMIEPYTTPDFAAMIQAEKDAAARTALFAQEMEEQRMLQEANKAEAAAKAEAFKAKLDTLTDINDLLKEWKSAGAPHPAPKPVCEARTASGLSWRQFIASI